MKKIIDNKIYDTEKADMIFEFRKKCKGERCWLIPDYYFWYWTDAQIYKTKKGNYFLHLNEKDGYKENIEIITEIEAKETIMKLDPNRYLELFGNINIEEA